MKITNARARLLRVPVRFPLIEDPAPARVILFEIETAEGVTGHALSYYPMASATVTFLNDDVAPMVSAYSVFERERIRQDMALKLTNRVLGGVWSSAASLVDIALWDALGKCLEQPIWKLLGGARSSVPTYVTYGLPRYTRQQLVDVAHDLIDQGHSRLKIVVGASSDPKRDLFGVPTRDDIEEDAARVRQVREALGPRPEIMIDANKNPTLPQAVRLARLLEDADIAWFEDPVSMADMGLMAELRSRTSIPIASGSLGMADVRTFKQLLTAGAVDIAQPNVRDIGGYTGGLKAASVADAFNVPIAMGGNWPHLNMHLYGGVANGGLVEFHLQGSSVASQIYENAPQPIDGLLTLPDDPGLGLRLNRNAVSEFEV